MRFFFTACIFYCVLFLSSCYFISHDVVIDNPSSHKLTVSIDKEVFILAPNSMISISVSNGKHQISVKEDSSKTLLKSWKDLGIYKDGILNITSSEYIIQYSNFKNFEKIKSTEIPDHSIEINGYTYQGNLKKIDSSVVFIEKTWDRGLEENLTNIEAVNPANKSLVKIYHVEEFENDFLRNIR